MKNDIHEINVKEDIYSCSTNIVFGIMRTGKLLFNGGEALKALESL